MYSINQMINRQIGEEMNILKTTGTYRSDSAVLPYANGFESTRFFPDLRLDRDSKEVLSMISHFLGILTLGAIAVVTVSGQFPWFVAPLIVFSLFAVLMPRKGPRRERVKC